MIIGDEMSTGEPQKPECKHPLHKPGREALCPSCTPTRPNRKQRKAMQAIGRRQAKRRGLAL
jgi:hypothetical protein